MRRGVGAVLALCAIVACDEPAEPDVVEIETAYLLDRVNGAAPPGAVCEQGSVEQLLEFESFALREDDTYGRFQRSRIDGDVVEQQEEGEIERTTGAIRLINAEEDTLVLELLDAAGDRVRRVHACGDTLRYTSVPVAGAG